jgi:hypothetical protein
VGVLAVRQNSMLVAILGLIGGYCTPHAAARGHPEPARALRLPAGAGLGILWIAQAKQWRLLNYLSFVFTYAHLHRLALPHAGRGYQSQFNAGHQRAGRLLRRCTPRWCMAQHPARHESHRAGDHLPGGNAALAGLLAYGIIRSAWGRPYPALGTLALSLFFVLHVMLFLRHAGCRTVTCWSPCWPWPRSSPPSRCPWCCPANRSPSPGRCWP